MNAGETALLLAAVGVAVLMCGFSVFLMGLLHESQKDVRRLRADQAPVEQAVQVVEPTRERPIRSLLVPAQRGGSAS